MRQLTTFPRHDEFEKAKALLAAAQTAFEVVEPGAGHTAVGVPGIVVEQEGRTLLAGGGVASAVCSGWVEFHPTTHAHAAEAPPRFAEDVFGSCAVMVLAPCVADAKKIRLVAHVSGDLAPVFPYLNAIMGNGLYNNTIPSFTFMEGYRLITLYSQRLTVAKSDEIVDAWRVLEKARRMVNDAWARRSSITPSTQMRKKPPVLEIYKRLPGINCGKCGEKTCMAFAMRLWNGEAEPHHCAPVFDGDFAHLKEMLSDLAAAVGVTPPMDD